VFIINQIYLVISKIEKKIMTYCRKKIICSKCFTMCRAKKPQTKTV